MRPSTMPISTCKSKEFSPLSLGMGFTMYAGLYVSSLTFFILGLAYNKKGKFRE